MIFLASFHTIRSLEELILWGGYLLLFVIIFAETGLFAGFFLPGDSLLITAGLIAASGSLNIFLVLAILVFGAVLGDATGYGIGKKLKNSIFTKKDSRFFHRQHLEKAEAFYKKHGSKTVFFARFIPIVRSFTATLAGVTAMPFGLFLFFSFCGSCIWVLCFTLIGYYVARLFPYSVQYLHTIILAGIILIVASALKSLKQQKKSQ